MTGSRQGRRAARLVLAAIVVSLATSAVIVWLVKPSETAHPDTAGGVPSETVTVPVERGTLTSELRLNASLDYGDSAELPAAVGVITALPTPGQIVESGHAVYEADGRPVILLQGERPIWRELAEGMDDGQDVVQLEANLARLGFFGREPDTRFDRSTTDAVTRWQKHLGVPATGTVTGTDVVVVNAPSIRISRVAASLGQSGTSPASYTATTLRALIKLTADQAGELQIGTPVTVVLPDGTGIENTIASVAPGGQPAGDGEQATPPTAVVEFPDQTRLLGIGPAAVRVVVRTSAESTETLIVPVTALVATARHRYAVELLTAEGIVRVAVNIGLVADARVQIVASGPSVDGAPTDAPVLAEGDEVVIAR
jgi:peptidoglycan hydrolase-like protein with peptidoglycan-binding domain